ncbi:hypothetical protein TWF694_002131 [Orbilia ellipsospora]|uniref:Uncharacterized protein n=1 Tax=Orbilia ellipsospora TaxID=2528407 RepID=A0AAV9X605_9PEZI
MAYVNLNRPLIDSFKKLSSSFAKIEAPAPWDYERNRFTTWGNAAGLGDRGPPSLNFDDPDIREEVMGVFYGLEEDFGDEITMMNRCGLTQKKAEKSGGALKRGLKKLAGKKNDSSGNQGAAGTGDKKFVVKYPQIWTIRFGLMKGEIDFLYQLVPSDYTIVNVDELTQGFAGVSVSSTQPTAGVASDPSAEEERMFAELEKLEQFLGVKDEGVVSVSLSPSTNYSAKIKVSVYYNDERPSVWQEESMGYVKMGHGSFELYHRRRYIKQSTSEYITDTEEDSVLFDVESNPKYENINPGTCTLEGFGMEAWNYELSFGRPRDNSIIVSYARLPNVSAKQLIRRMDEFQKTIGTKFGWTPTKDKHDLTEFFGNMGVTYFDGSEQRIGDFYQQLNRRDIFTDFTTMSSIATQWSQPNGEGVMGIWNFLYQVILAKELSLRLLIKSDTYYTGFTSRVLASLILQDVWLSGVSLKLEDPPMNPSHFHKAKTPDEVANAEKLANDGQQAAARGDWQAAVNSYTEALKIDNSIASYTASRALAYLALNNLDDGHYDASVAARLSPRDKFALSVLGDANIRIKNLTRAKECYQNALTLAPGDQEIKKKLDDVTTQIKTRIQTINSTANDDLAMTLEKQHNDEKWDIAGRNVELHSKVHERQVEGLIIFAERMKWPWVHEVREAAEDIYGKIRGGATVPFHVIDWIYGTTLPGEWMALKIMSAMILLTESVKKEGIAPFYDCSFITKQRSYHRVRSALGRVLGCLPGVTSLCGWIGPCPPVTFDPPLQEPIGSSRQGKHIRLKARNIGLVDPPDPADNVIRIIGKTSHMTLQPAPEDVQNFDGYLKEIKDPANWVVPAVPPKSASTAILHEVILKALPLESAVDTNDPDSVEKKTEYRATLKFSIGNDGPGVSYTLFTNPVFVTPPPCSGGPKGLGHEVHKRELSQFKHVIEAENLKDYTPEDEKLVIINATGNGAEVLARAWCAERGRAAVIRRIGGPCLACTADIVLSLKQKVLIWVS